MSSAQMAMPKTDAVEMKGLDAWICSGCGDDVDDEYPLPHPLYGVAPMCGACLGTYNDGEFTVLAGHEIYCRWCGNGGDLFLCDQCPKALCHECATRNLGADYVTRENRATGMWKCGECDPALIEGAARRNQWNGRQKSR